MELNSLQMTNGNSMDYSIGKPPSGAWWARAGAAAATIIALSGVSLGASVEYCDATAQLQFKACHHEKRDDNLIQQAICLNLADEVQRTQCTTDAKLALKEAKQLCKDQREERETICDALGQARYTPDFTPANFDTNFVNPPHLNAYFPIKVGYRWDFAAAAANETNTVEVLGNTKLIEGVTCVVQRDLVSLNGVAKEYTDDWLAQRVNGDVVYCGEEVKDYEVFPMDSPPDPELIKIDGSFKVGRDGDKPGNFFLGAPMVGMIYRQEYSVGNAEDIATVLSTTYDFGTDPVLDQFVPQALVQYLCNNDCIVTLESQPSAPGVSARKYYARDIGGFLEIDVESGEVNRLVGCNVDPRCATLPAP